MYAELAAALKARARELGFVRVGIARATRLESDAQRLDAWLEAGFHAGMRYMKDTAQVRADPRHPRMLPGARSVVALAASHMGKTPPAGPRPALVARYAQGRDYHNVLGKRLRKLSRLLTERGHRVRYSTDSMPVLERAWAQRAGLGFIGKNGCLIVPGLGSHVFLATLLTDAELEADEPMSERCGSCSRCLSACPTQALVGPRQLDARRCIAYLTIEHRDRIAQPLRSSLGAWIFGCDVCQDVCPFNQGRAARQETPEEFTTPARWASVDAAALLTMDEAAFRRYAHGSPLKRAGWEGMARNAAIALGNSASRRALPVLQEAASTHASPAVREAASWASRRLSAR